MATARVLAAEGYEVVAPRDQACCGALHLHAGRREEGKRMARAVAERFAGVDAIAVNAAGCGSHLKDAGLGVRVADVSELLGRGAEGRAAPARAARRLPGLVPPVPRPGDPRRAARPPRLDPRPRASRAGRAGDLLRLGGDLQPHAAGRGARARRPQGTARPRHRAGRATRARTRAASSRSRPRCAVPAARCRHCIQSSCSMRRYGRAGRRAARYRPPLAQRPIRRRARMQLRPWAN